MERVSDLWYSNATKGIVQKEIVRLCTPAPRAGFRGVSASSLGAAGLVAVVVRDALGRLLMGLVHG